LGEYVLNYRCSQGDKWAAGSQVFLNTNAGFTFEMGHPQGKT